MSPTRFVGHAMLVVAVACSAHADPFPFVEGVRYEYEYDIGNGMKGTYHSFFSGTAVVGGADVRVQRREGGTEDGTQVFWSETQEDDKYVHGSQTRFETEPFLFTPPILEIDAPFFVGKTWSAKTQTSDGVAIHIDYEVVAFGDVVVPAGVFQAFTVRETAQFPEANAKLNTARSGDVPRLVGTFVRTRSYAAGIGLVLSVLGDGGRTDRLIAVHTVGVEGATWTQIRGLYR